MKFAHLKEGDEVYHRPGYLGAGRGKGQMQKVDKVVLRTKAFYIGRERFDMETGQQLNANGCVSRCWLNEAEFQEGLDLQNAWWQITRRLTMTGRPKGLTMERMNELAIELIGKPLKDLS